MKTRVCKLMDPEYSDDTRWACNFTSSRFGGHSAQYFGTWEDAFDYAMQVERARQMGWI